MSYYTCLSPQAGDSALMIAASRGDTEVVVELVKAGADLNLQNEVQRPQSHFTNLLNHASLHRKGTQQ